MFSQDEIDAVLRDAQQAVDTLVDEVGGAIEPSGPGVHSPASATEAAPESTVTSSASDFGQVERILKLNVPIRVRLARRSMPLSRIMQLGPGTILEFDRTVDRDLQMRSAA